MTEFALKRNAIVITWQQKLANGHPSYKSIIRSGAVSASDGRESSDIVPPLTTPLWTLGYRLCVSVWISLRFS